MQSTENQRVKDSIRKLKDLGLIKTNADLADSIGIDINRINYITKKGGGNFTRPEINLLAQKFPQINWEYVFSGEGELLSEEIHDGVSLVKESEMIYSKDPDYKRLLNEILLGTSKLSETEQNKILKREVVNLQQKVINIYENTNPLKMWEDLKKMFKG